MLGSEPPDILLFFPINTIHAMVGSFGSHEFMLCLVIRPMSLSLKLGVFITALFMVIMSFLERPTGFSVYKSMQKKLESHSCRTVLVLNHISVPIYFWILNLCYIKLRDNCKKNIFG